MTRDCWFDSTSKLLSHLKPSTTELHEALYPCYVISLSKLQQMETLEQHEALLEKDALEVLTRTSRTPSGAFTFFISQNWESKTSPDNAMGTKLAWMKNLRDHLAIPPSIEIWVWWDLISIPQRQRKLQLRAIASLPNYASLCSRFIPLVRDGDRRRVDALLDHAGLVLAHECFHDARQLLEQQLHELVAARVDSQVRHPILGRRLQVDDDDPLACELLLGEPVVGGAWFRLLALGSVGTRGSAPEKC